VSNPIVDRFRDGQVADPMKAAAARGALPIPAEDLLQVLFHLRGEKALQPDIVKTISEIPLDTLLAFAADPSTPPPMLDFLARGAFKRAEVMEKLLLNLATPDSTLQLVAQHGTESLLELLMLNQVRLTRAPVIIQAMLANQNVTLSIRRRLKEIWELHQRESVERGERDARRAEEARMEAEAAAAAQAKAEAEAQAAAEVAAAEAVAAEAGDGVGEPDLKELAEMAGLEGLDDLEDLGESQIDAAVLEQLKQEAESPEELRLAERLLTMSVAEKVQLALKGDRGARSMLIRESSKLIQEAVIKSPKITENEIETFSGMRSLSQDVLRKIASIREYTGSYTIALNLIKNPRCPQPNAIALMPNLQARDLKFLLKDKNVSEAIRRQAKILMDKRQKR
jgi:nucleoid-associated protein YgaU